MNVERLGVVGCGQMGHGIVQVTAQAGEFRERRFARPPTLRQMLAAGWYGRKSGRGFYDYSGDEPVAVELR